MSTTGRSRVNGLATGLATGLARGLAAFSALICVFAAEPSATAAKRNFDTSMGERDPRKKPLPRTHRFRLALHSHLLKLDTVTPTEADGRPATTFYHVPIMADFGYQAQFLKRVMARAALGIGGNAGNTTQAMPFAMQPQAYLGYQGSSLGLALGYGFMFTQPQFKDYKSSRVDAIGQPIIRDAHIVRGELSFTSRVDRVAVTFALGLGGITSNLQHFERDDYSWRFIMNAQIGVFFDGSIRRAKAKKKAFAKP